MRTRKEIALDMGGGITRVVSVWALINKDGFSRLQVYRDGLPVDFLALPNKAQRQIWAGFTTDFREAV